MPTRSRRQTPGVISWSRKGWKREVTYEERLRAAAARRPNIQIGREWSVAEALADAKVFLSLQQWDNYPSQSLLEAMLSECCIVATDTGDTRLLVADPWGACLAAEASAAEYVRAVMRFLEMPESERQPIGEAAREFIVSTHTQERYMDYLAQLWGRASAG